MKLSDGLEDMEYKHKTQVGCWMATVCKVGVIKFPAKKGILVDLAFFSCAPGFHKIRYISWVNDGIAGKLILQLTNMMSCSARGHLKVNKSWIFLKYMPGVLKTSAEISPEMRAGAQPQAVLLP